MSSSRFIFRTIFLSVIFLSEIPAARPNVVFIITDDQSWDSLGFMGGEVHRPRIDRMAKGVPFFPYFSTTLHHGPAPWVHRFSLDADPRMTGEGFVEEGFDVLPPRKSVLQRNRAAGFRDRQAYALWLDDGVGAILDKVKELGLEKDTLIVFVSDHGSWRHGKATLHDFGMRVPMLCRWPGTITPGTKFDGLVANIDFAPTILDLPYLTRNGHLGHHASKVNPHYFEADQLYDLQKDPEETENVFGTNPEVAERMKRKLAKALREFPERPFGEFAN